MPPFSGKPQPLAPAEPKYGRTFDPWNSVTTGHQVAEQSGPHGWRESRTRKLRSQLAAGHSGGERLSDTVGRGAADFDDKLGVLVSAVSSRATNSVADMLRTPGAMHGRAQTPLGPGTTTAAVGLAGNGPGKGKENNPSLNIEDKLTARRAKEDAAREEAAGNKKRGIFDGLVVYVNGSTHPLVSDHRLKHLLAENGARLAIHLGRRQVTHVVVGRPAGAGGAGSAGGGLAGGKLDREIRRVGGCGIKFVGVEWILESLKAGRRLPEARFASLKIAPKTQTSVYRAFSKVHAAGAHIKTEEGGMVPGPDS